MLNLELKNPSKQKETLANFSSLKNESLGSRKFAAQKLKNESILAEPEVTREIRQEMFDAIKENNVPKLVKHLSNGVDPNTKDYLGYTLLNSAIKHSNKEMVSILLQFKANPDIKDSMGDTAIHTVVKRNDLEIAKIILPHTQNINEANALKSTALHLAVAAKNTEFIDLLVQHKPDLNVIDINKNSVLHISIDQKDAELAKKFLDAGADANLLNGKQKTPLHMAIENDMNSTVNHLLGHGANPNLTNGFILNAPLYVAITKNNIDVSKALISNGADINLSISNGNTLLMYAAERKANEIAELLINSGLDIRKTNKGGDNAVHYCARSGNLPIIEKLASMGMDLGMKNEINGKTPLHLSVYNGQSKMADYLISKNVNIEARDKEGNTPIFEVVPKIYHWKYIPKPSKDQSDIANSLLNKGANLNQYETDNFFMAQLADTINVNHPDKARNFMFTRIGNEWEKLDARRIDGLLNQFAAKPSLKQEDVEPLLLKLLHPDINYANQTEAIRHSAHLRSWNGIVKVAGQPLVEAEGWWMHTYPPLKTKSLIMSLNKVSHNEIDCQKEFGESKENVLRKIKSEIASQMSTYYSQRHHDMIRMVTDKSFNNDFRNYEVSKYCKEIVKAPIGTEWAIASGFPGHAIYMGFRKDDADSVSRVVYNLGGGLQMHPANKEGLVYPNVVSKIKLDHFINETPEATNYLKGVLSAKLGDTYDPLVPIYKDVKLLGGQEVLQNIPGIPQKRQLVGNCVLKNNNAAARNRMRNDRLFNWVKGEETAFADEMSKIDKKIIEEKEREKDLLSFNYVIRTYEKTKDIDSTTKNLLTFLEKRSDQKIVGSGKLRDAERIALYFQRMDEKTLDSFMIQRGALNMVKAIADTKYCDTLNQVINKYRPNKTFANMYAQING